MDRQQKIEILQKLDEKALTKRFLIPLMKGLGCENIEYCHGRLEYGKDIIYCIEDELGNPVHVGVQVKATKITTSHIDTIFRQIACALGEPFTDLIDGKRKELDKVCLVTSHEFTEDAKMSLWGSLKAVNLHRLVICVDGNSLVDLLDRYLPPVFWEEYDYFNRYFNAMKREFEAIKDMSALGQRKPIPLEEIYVSLRLSEKPGREISIEKREIVDRKEYSIEDEKYRREQILDADDAIMKFDKVVIVGAPGSGKTTLLKHIALKSCTDNLEKQKRLILPVMINIEELSESTRTMRDYIDDVFEQYDFPKARDFVENDLKEGRCQLLLDGFDELATVERRRGVIEKIEMFISIYPKNQFIITSRIAGYHDELKGFQKLELMEFDHQQIEEFIINWFSKMNPEKARLMKEAIKESERIRTIARNPLMITIIAIIYGENRELSQRRTELYQRCMEVLLSRWDMVRGIENRYEAKAKEKVLRKLALEAFLLERRMLTREDVLKKFSEYLPEIGIDINEKEDFLDEISKRNALLREVSVGIYDFLHLSFQEYLVALELRETRNYKTLLDHLYDPWWEIVILLFAGFDRDANELLSKIQEKEKTDEQYREDIFYSNLILSGKCIAEADYTKAETKNQIISNLWSLYQTAEFSSLREKVIEALALIRPESLIDFHIRQLKDKDSDIRGNAASVLGYLGSEKAIEPLIRALTTDKARYVRRSAADALGALGSERAIEPLIEALTTDENTYVRGSAADALGALGSERAIDSLIKALTTDENTYVRGSAAYALGTLSSERAIEPLIKALTTDENNYIRWRAAYALGSIGNERAIDSLIKALTTDENDYVRGIAAYALTGTVSERAIDPLIKALTTDENIDVRGIAAYALGTLRSERAIDPLIRALTTDKASYVRENAAYALGSIGNERAIDPLIEALTMGRDSYVQGGAAYALGVLGNERAIDPLIEALTTDEASYVRENAASALGSIGNERAIDPLIKALTTDEDTYVRWSAASALGILGSEKAIEPLVSALKDEGEWAGGKVKDKAFISLEKVSKKTKKRIFPAN